MFVGRVNSLISRQLDARRGIKGTNIEKGYTEIEPPGRSDDALLLRLHPRKPGQRRSRGRGQGARGLWLLAFRRRRSRKRFAAKAARGLTSCSESATRCRFDPQKHRATDLVGGRTTTFSRIA